MSKWETLYMLSLFFIRLLATGEQMGACWWHHSDDSGCLLWLAQMRELFLHNTSIWGDKWGLKWLAKNRKKTRFILIRTHTLALLFSLPPPQGSIRSQEIHTSPTAPSKYILECMRIPLLGFLWFITSLFVTCGKKLAKILFALKFEV